MAITDALQQILNNNPSPESAQMVQSIMQRNTQLGNVGIDTEEAMPRSNLFMDALDLLAAPGRAAMGVVDTALRGDMFSPGVGLGIERAFQEDTVGQDLVKRHLGIENPLINVPMGFAADVLTDPLSWINRVPQAASAGGRALSKTGAALKDAAEVGMIRQGALPSAMQLGDISDNAFQALGRYKDEIKQFTAAEKGGNEIDKLISAQRMDNLKSQFAPYLEAAGQNPNDVTHDLIKNLFDKPKVRIGMNIPFLGHVTGSPAKATAEELIGGTPLGELFVKDVGKIKGAALATAETIGKAIKPGFIGKDFEIPDALLEVFANANSLAASKVSEAIKKVAPVDAAIAEIPFIGKAYKVGKSVGSRAVGVGKATSKLMQDIFVRKTVEGAANRYLDLERIGVTAGAKGRAEMDAFKTFQDMIEEVGPDGARRINQKGMDNLKEAALAIDAVAMSPLKRVLAGGIGAEKEKEFLGIVNRNLKSVGDVKDSALLKDIAANGGLDDQFRMGINALLQSPEYTPEVKEAITRLMGQFDTIAAREAQHGISYGFTEAYIPHRYQTLGKGSGSVTGSGPQANFMKRRHFPTLSDALNAGLVGDFDAVGLLAKRLENSERLIANRSYYNRMVVQNGMPFELVKQLFAEAAKEPGGAAWKALQRRGIATPAIMSKDEVEAAHRIFSSQGKAQKIAAEEYAKHVGPESISKAVLHGVPVSSEAKLGDDLANVVTPQELAAIQAGAQDFGETLKRELVKADFVPKDFNMPEPWMGEIAESTFDHKGNLMVMPTDISRAMKENLAARDFIKAKAANSPFFSSLLGSMDAATAWFKRFVTVPFPAYWFNNFFMGDQIHRFMDGGLAALDPGLAARTHNLLSGKSALRVKNTGAMYSPHEFSRALRQHGIKFSVADLMSVLDDTGKLNLDNVLASTRSISENLATKGSRFYALTQAQERLQNKFETFFRVNHIVHRLENGDTFQTALQRANETLINYRDLSPIEQSFMRRFYMFYGWISKSTKKTLNALVTQPGDLLTQLKLARSTSQFFADPNSAPTADKWEQDLWRTVTSAEQVAFPIGKTGSGKTLTARGFGLPLNTLLQQFSLQRPRDLSVSEVVNATAESGRRTLQKQFASANPFINSAAQLVSGKNLYFDKPLDAAFLRRLPSLEAMAEKIGMNSYTDIPKDIDSFTKWFLNAVPDGQGRLVADPGKYWALVNLIPGLGRALASANTIANPDISKSRGMLPLFTGVRVEEQDPERSFLGGLNQSLDQLAQEKSYQLRKKSGLYQQ